MLLVHYQFFLMFINILNTLVVLSLEIYLLTAPALFPKLTLMALPITSFSLMISPNLIYFLSFIPKSMNHHRSPFVWDFYINSYCSIMSSVKVKITMSPFLHSFLYLMENYYIFLSFFLRNRHLDDHWYGKDF